MVCRPGGYQVTLLLSVYCDIRICRFNRVIEIIHCLFLGHLSCLDRRDRIALCIADCLIVTGYLGGINLLRLV